MDAAFRDKVVIITGGSKGVGAACARRFAAAGARLALVARGQKELKALADELRPKCEVLTIAMDVADSGECRDLFKKVELELGAVHCLVNNAGLHARGNVEALEPDALTRMVRVNLEAPVMLSRLAIPYLRRAGGGAIVNVLSAAALTNIPNMGGYGPSKTATRFLTAGVRAELADQGTQVTALIVGSVDTRMAAHVDGRKEQPIDIGRAGVTAIRKNIDEMDTDWMATSVRARIAMDPKGYERGLAKLLHAEKLSTGRS